MYYVYGIIDGGDIDGDVLRGHSGDDVAVFRLGELGFLVSDAAAASVEPSPENVWRHENILHALMARHAVLPARFGLICDRDTLSSVLESNRHRIEEDMRRVAGRVEIAVRIGEKTPPRDMTPKPPAARSVEASGKAYLLTRVAEHRRTLAVAAKTRPAVCHVRRQIDRLALETRWSDAVDAWQPVKGSCLVERHGVAQFVRAAEERASCRQDIVVTCTGPWAPYSFVSALAVMGGTR